MLTPLRDRDVLSLKPLARTYTIGGKSVIFESAKLALFAQGAVTIRDESGNYLLTTAGIADGKPDASFFPLTVEYQERYYAAGKIGGNRFMKREGRPSETAILTSRLIDRPIRPMFPKGTTNDVQIISTILSASGESDFGFWGITGASLALQIAGVHQFEGPVSGVRIAIDAGGNFVFDPTIQTLQTAQLELVVAGTADAITMVESQGREVSDALMLKAFEYAHSLIKDLSKAQEDFIAAYRGAHGIRELSLSVKEKSLETYDAVKKAVTAEQVNALFNLGKLEFHDALHDLEWAVLKALWVIGEDGESVENSPHSKGDVVESVYKVVQEHMRERVLSTGIRLDGRKSGEVRPVRVENALLPRTHGSALFQRGVTQVLTITTLGGPGDVQIIDDMYEESTKQYIHHYNFPPYSVGEVRPLRGVGRREVGHWRLAEKALEPVLPKVESFPYFIRTVSETLTCNGSSSMASVCGSTMSLMDAGVPITGMVAGVAMGMIYDEESGKFVILSDIQAQEDFLGDMDFKVAKTEKGVTALQMDCKIKGLPMDVIRDVLSGSNSALDYIRGEMKKCLSESKKELSPYAPLIFTLRVPEHKIRIIIGKGGETIQGLCKEFNVEIDLQDDGTCSVTAKNQVDGKAAVAAIEAMTKDIEVGAEMSGAVVKILDGIGAIIDLGGGKSGMIHISRFNTGGRVEKVDDVVKMGDTVNVRVIGIDEVKGKVSLERMV